MGEAPLTAEALNAAGVLLDGNGLHPTAAGARVRFSGGRPAVVDGPFPETEATVAGYFTIRVSSRDEAIEWARRWPAIDGDGEVELEIRQVFEADDMGPEFAPELREREARVFGEAAQRKEG